MAPLLRKSFSYLHQLEELLYLSLNLDFWQCLEVTVTASFHRKLFHMCGSQNSILHNFLCPQEREYTCLPDLYHVQGTGLLPSCHCCFLLVSKTGRHQADFHLWPPHNYIITSTQLTQTWDFSYSSNIAWIYIYNSANINVFLPFPKAIIYVLS